MLGIAPRLAARVLPPPYPAPQPAPAPAPAPGPALPPGHHPAPPGGLLGDLGGPLGLGGGFAANDKWLIPVIVVAAVGIFLGFAGAAVRYARQLGVPIRD